MPHLTAAEAASDDTRPANLHAERTILGAMMLEPSAVIEATALLKADDFSLASHRQIYEVMLYLADESKPIDEILVSHELQRQRQLDAIGGAGYLADLTSNIPRKVQIAAYAAIVRDKSLVRQLMSICETGLMEGGDHTLKAVDILGQVESRLMLLSEQTVVGGFADVAKIVAGFDSIDHFFSGSTEEGTIATGFALDKWTRNFKAGEMIVIAARPSMGKTAWALNFACNSAIRFRKVVGILSLEMSKESLLKRMVQSESGIPTSRLEDGKVGKEDRQRSYNALESLMTASIHIDDKPFTTMQEIRAKARRLKQQHNLDVLIIDYIQLIEPPAKSENRNQEVSAISRGLKGLAKELGIPIIVLAQLNRKCEERADKRPMLSDLRDSGAIEQDADIVAFIYRGEVYDSKNPDLRGLAEMIVAKQREGQIGVLPMVYAGNITKFDDRVWEGDYAG